MLFDKLLKTLLVYVSVIYKISSKISYQVIFTSEGISNSFNLITLKEEVINLWNDMSLIITNNDK